MYFIYTCDYLVCMGLTFAILRLFDWFKIKSFRVKFVMVFFWWVTLLILTPRMIWALIQMLWYNVGVDGLFAVKVGKCVEKRRKSNGCHMDKRKQ